MQYTIHSREIQLPYQKETTPVRGIGVEVVPPLPPKLAENIGSVLTRAPDGHDNGYNQFAKHVDITRSGIDETEEKHGTVFIIEPNPYRELTPAQVAEAIGGLLNPCDLPEHHIEYVNH